jgi:PAS domain-containing protein
MKNLIEKMEGITQLIIAAISGGAVAAILNYLSSGRAAKKDEFDVVVETWRKDNERLRAENAALGAELHQMRIEIGDLRSKVILMESAHTDAPLPMWLKDLNGRMLSVNKAYEEAFLLPIGKDASDYIGRYDVDIWGEEVAKGFRENDLEAINSDAPIWKIENVGELGNHKVVKYVRMAGKVKLGIAGIAIPIVEK